jgi:hypothetical protein
MKECFQDKNRKNFPENLKSLRLIKNKLHSSISGVSSKQGKVRCRNRTRIAGFGD